jgi:phospholipid transport system substrate-binding protein
MTRRSLLLRSVAFGLVVLFTANGVAVPRAQAAQTDAAAFVTAFSQEGITDILAAPIANAEKQERFRDMFKTYFDLPAIGRFVLTRYWKAATPEEQARFTKLFEDVIVYTWSRRFSEYNGQSLMVQGQQPDGAEGTLVKSTIVGHNNGSFGVDWRLRKRPDGFKVLDIVIEGVSMAITYRQDYSTVIAQTGSFDGLLAQMEKQVVQMKAQQGV